MFGVFCLRLSCLEYYPESGLKANATFSVGSDVLVYCSVLAFVV